MLVHGVRASLLVVVGGVAQQAVEQWRNLQLLRDCRISLREAPVCLHFTGVKRVIIDGGRVASLQLFIRLHLSHGVRPSCRWVTFTHLIHTHSL